MERSSVPPVPPPDAATETPPAAASGAWVALLLGVALLLLLCVALTLTASMGAGQAGTLPSLLGCLGTWTLRADREPELGVGGRSRGDGG